MRQLEDMSEYQMSTYNDTVNSGYALRARFGPWPTDFVKLYDAFGSHQNASRDRRVARSFRL